MSAEPFDPETLIEAGLAQLADTKRAIDLLSEWIKAQPNVDATVAAIVAVSTILLSKAPSDRLRDQTLVRANILLRFHYGLEIDDGGALDRLIEADPEANALRCEAETLNDYLARIIGPKDNGDG